ARVASVGFQKTPGAPDCQSPSLCRESKVAPVRTKPPRDPRNEQGRGWSNPAVRSTPSRASVDSREQQSKLPDPKHNPRRRQPHPVETVAAASESRKNSSAAPRFLSNARRVSRSLTRHFQ